MHKRISRAVIHLIWYALVTSIILSGLFISLIWVTHNNIEPLKPRILNWVEERAGMPVQVENLSIDWHGIFPELNLTQINLINPSSNTIFTQVDSVSISLDLASSLKTWQPTISYLTLSGLDLTLIHDPSGEMRIEGWPATDTKDGGALDWLLQQRDLRLTNATITVEDQRYNLDTLTLTNLSASLLLNSQNPLNKQRLISSKTQLSPTGDTVEFALKLIGDPRTKNWSANLVTTSNNLNIHRFMPSEQQQMLDQTLQKIGLNMAAPELDSTLEFVFEKAKLASAKGNLNLSDHAANTTLATPFNLQKTLEQKWQIVLPLLSLKQDEENALLDQLTVTLPHNFNLEQPIFDAQIRSVALHDLFRFLSKSSSINDINKKLPASFNTNAVTGDLKQLHLSYDGTQTEPALKIRTDFSHVGIVATENHPGFTGLTGSISSDQTRWQVNLASYGLEISAPRSNEPVMSSVIEPIVVNELSGQIDIQKTDESLTVSIERLNLTDPRLQMQFNGHITQSAGQTITSLLRGTIFGGTVDGLVDLIPLEFVPTETDIWLRRSLKSGEIKGGTFQLEGDLANFPFDHNEGIFDIRIDVENGILQFDPAWPDFKNILADVHFNGRRMMITSPSAMLYDAQLSNVSVEMPDLLNDGRHLLIKGHAVGAITDALKFVAESPLNESIGKRLSKLDLQGPMQLDLTLDVPLHDSSVTEIDGLLQLENTTLKMQQPTITLTNLNGQLAFGRESWHSKSLKARLFDSPVAIALERQSENDEQIQVKLSGVADRVYLQNRLTELGLKADELRILKQLSGSTRWQADLDLNEVNGKDSTQLRIASDLSGFVINAPAPLGKIASEKRQLRIETPLSNGSASSSTFQYGRIVSGRWQANADSDSPQLKHLSLRFGSDTAPAVLEESVTIAAHGSLKEIDLGEWQNFLTENALLSISNNRQSNMSIETDMSVGDVHLAGYIFKKNQINLKKRANNWQIHIQNTAMDGTVNRLEDGSVKAELDRLRLSSSTTKNNNSSLNLTSIPALDIHVNHFSYNDLTLGELKLVSHPQVNGLKVETLHLKNEDLSIDATGEWIFINTQQQSRFSINAEGETLEGFLSTFGYNVDGIHADHARFVSEANWSGTPADFSLDRVQGTLSLSIGKGRLTEVDNRVGKIFGLLSIQSLGRRLALDFNDLFQKGFSFDAISGKFDVARGEAYTNDLSVSGPSAQIDISGRVGLKNKDYDQIITIIPSVSDSLPVASALFGPIGAGVGAALFLAEKIIPILPDTIDQVLKRQYALTGPWTEPDITPVAAPQKQSDQSSSGPDVLGPNKKL